MLEQWFRRFMKPFETKILLNSTSSLHSNLYCIYSQTAFVCTVKLLFNSPIGKIYEGLRQSIVLTEISNASLSDFTRI